MAHRERDGTPSAALLEQLSQLLGRLKAAFEPIASGACDHRHREDRYRPGRVLQDLVRARNATCPAPGCGASSSYSDLDHTQPWPGGDTDECNLGPASVPYNVTTNVGAGSAHVGVTRSPGVAACHHGQYPGRLGHHRTSGLTGAGRLRYRKSPPRVGDCGPDGRRTGIASAFPSPRNGERGQ